MNTRTLACFSLLWLCPAELQLSGDLDDGNNDDFDSSDDDSDGTVREPLASVQEVTAQRRDHRATLRFGHPGR